MPKTAVILPAAGRSVRFGSGEKKPFIPLEGKAIWMRSAELFWNRPDVSRVYVVVAPEDMDQFKQRFGAAFIFANAEIVAGGSERFESVANALAKIPDDVDFVAIHDAVRPLCPSARIDAVFAAAADHGAAMLAVPVADTLKRVDDSATIVETVPRAGLWAAQTPQVFRRDWLVQAYANRNSLTVAITDDAQLVEATGHSVKVVESTAANFKITTKADFELATSILAAANRPREEPKKSVRPFDDEQ
jgi:2-C-methyl-D-erythritol 4-phosphate cytidylyltransferase